MVFDDEDHEEIADDVPESGPQSSSSLETSASLWSIQAMSLPYKFSKSTCWLKAGISFASLLMINAASRVE